MTKPQKTSEEFKRFESLARGILTTPKADLVKEQRKSAPAKQKPKKSK